MHKMQNNRLTSQNWCWDKIILQENDRFPAKITYLEQQKKGFLQKFVKNYTIYFPPSPLFLTKEKTLREFLQNQDSRLEKKM